MLRISSSRDVSDPSAGQPGHRLGTAYDLFYSQFASVEPDPTKRDQLVRSFLATRASTQVPHSIPALQLISVSPSAAAG